MDSAEKGLGESVPVSPLAQGQDNFLERWEQQFLGDKSHVSTPLNGLFELTTPDVLDHT